MPETPTARPISELVDCGTTHLDAEIGEAWEVAVVLREQDGGRFTDTEPARQFAVGRTTADPETLRISCHDELSAGGPPEHNLEQPS
ncbi:hypothetical protein ACWEQC_08665 [Streptomyces shenzhenensis]